MLHNLIPLARAFRGRFPTAEIIIAGDDDAAKPDNPGRTAALQAAETVNGAAVFPDFGKDRLAHETDFNGLAVRYGLAAVKKQNSYLFNIALFDAVGTIASVTADPPQRGSISKPGIPAAPKLFSAV